MPVLVCDKSISIVYGAGPPLPGHNLEVCAGVICTIRDHLNSFPPPPGRVDLPSSTRLFIAPKTIRLRIERVLLTGLVSV